MKIKYIRKMRKGHKVRLANSCSPGHTVCCFHSYEVINRNNGRVWLYDPEETSDPQRDDLFHITLHEAHTRLSSAEFA